MYVQAVGGGAAVRLTGHPDGECCPVFSPDGRWLLYGQLERRESDIMLVENFR